MLEAVTDTVSQTLTDNLEAVTQAISAGLGTRPSSPRRRGPSWPPGLHPPAEKQAFQDQVPLLTTLGQLDPARTPSALPALPSPVTCRPPGPGRPVH